MKIKSWTFLYSSLLTAGSYMLLACLNKQNDALSVGYAGNNPCGSIVRRMLDIPSNATCDRIRLKITFVRNSSTQQSGTYTIDYTYGMQEQGGPGFQNGGSGKQFKGSWKYTKGAKSDPDALVYQLRKADGTTFSFVKLSENIIHPLNTDNTLMVGDGSFSYTLNRIKP